MRDASKRLSLSREEDVGWIAAVDRRDGIAVPWRSVECADKNRSIPRPEIPEKTCEFRFQLPRLGMQDGNASRY